MTEFFGAATTQTQPDMIELFDHLYTISFLKMHAVFACFEYIQCILYYTHTVEHISMEKVHVSST